MAKRKSKSKKSSNKGGGCLILILIVIFSAMANRDDSGSSTSSENNLRQNTATRTTVSRSNITQQASSQYSVNTPTLTNTFRVVRITPLTPRGLISVSSYTPTPRNHSVTNTHTEDSIELSPTRLVRTHTPRPEEVVPTVHATMANTSRPSNTPRPTHTTAPIESSNTGNSQNTSLEGRMVSSISPTIYYASGVINLRTCPNTSCSVAGQVGAGTNLTAIALYEGQSVDTGNPRWYKVNFGEGAAYVYSGVVTSQQSSVSTSAGGSSGNNSTTNNTTSSNSGGAPGPRPANCTQAVEMGYTAEQAAYWSHLDRDGDGVACYGD